MKTRPGKNYIFRLENGELTPTTIWEAAKSFSKKSKKTANKPKRESVEKKEKLYGPIDHLSIDKVLEADMVEKETQEEKAKLWAEVIDVVDAAKYSSMRFETIQQLQQLFTITRKV